MKNRVLTLLLAGLMAGQAVLPAMAAVTTDPANDNSAENATETETASAEPTAEDVTEEDTATPNEDSAESNDHDMTGMEESSVETATDAEETAAEKSEESEETTENEVVVLAAEDEVTADGETDAVAVTAVGADGWPTGGIPGSTGGVLFPQNSDGTVTINGQHVTVGARAHKTIDTVDSTALGVRMYMFRHPISEDYYSKYFYDTALDPDSRTPLADTGVRNVVGEDGYPIFANGESTRYLFDPDSDTYQATQVNHLFSQQIYDDSGYLSYNSMDNYAYLDPSTGDFRVYEDIGVPWWGYAVKEDGTLRYDESLLKYKFQGQFFPYDDLTAYVEPNIRQIANSDASEMSASDPRYNRALYRAAGYTFHYGMMLETDFVQPIDGMVTGSGQPENMRYEFTGDDIIWVFLDGVLVLVPAQIYTHGAGVGSIDFATGEVTMGTWTTTIRQMFELVGMEDTVEWNGDTFADYSEHTMQMFYAETGEDAARLQVRFNLVTIPDNQVDKHVYDDAGQRIDGKAVEAGDVLTYTVTAENPASVAKEVTIIDTLPEGVEFVSAENGGSCADGKVTWQQTLQAGAKRTVSCKVRVREAAVGTTLTNTAIEQVGQIAIRTNEVSNPVNSRYQITTEVVNGTITDSIYDIHKGTDQKITYAPEEGYVLDSITVDGEAVDPEQFGEAYSFENIIANHAIKVTYVKLVAPIKAVTQGDANVIGQYITDGEEVTYAIMVSNPSGVKQDITVTDTVSDSLTIKKVSDDGKIDGQKITWTLKDVPAHSSQTVSFTAAAVGTDKEQTIDNAAQMTIGGHTLTSNNVRILIPVKPKVTTKETTVTNKTVINETENNVVENNKTINNETKNNTKTNETQVNQTQIAETTTAANTTNTASAADSGTTTSNDVASANTATNVNSVTPVNNATISGYRNVNTGDASRTLILIAIAAAATVGLGIYYYRKRR